MAAASELPRLTWHFTVLNSEELNAFALPGGYVYVTRGLLALAGLLLVFPSLIEAVIEAAIGRDISYTYVPGILIGLGVLLWQAKGPAIQRPA